MRDSMPAGGGAAFGEPWWYGEQQTASWLNRFDREQWLRRYIKASMPGLVLTMSLSLSLSLCVYVCVCVLMCVWVRVSSLTRLMAVLPWKPNCKLIYLLEREREKERSREEREGEGMSCYSYSHCRTVGEGHTHAHTLLTNNIIVRGRGVQLDWQKSDVWEKTLGANL